MSVCPSHTVKADVALHQLTVEFLSKTRSLLDQPSVQRPTIRRIRISLRDSEEEERHDRLSDAEVRSKGPDSQPGGYGRNTNCL